MVTKKMPTKTRGRPTPPAREEAVRIRMTGEFKRWLESVAKAERLTVATLVELALVDRAKQNKHPDPPEGR